MTSIADDFSAIASKMQRRRDFTCPAPDPDAELQRLHADLVAKGEAIARLLEEDYGPGITPQSEAIEARISVEDDEWHDIAEEIADIPARTSVGLHVKAAALLLLLQDETCVFGDETLADIAAGDVGGSQDRLALSIARDLLATGSAT